MTRSRGLPVVALLVVCASLLFVTAGVGVVPSPIGVVAGAVALGAALVVGLVVLRRPAPVTAQSAAVGPAEVAAAAEPATPLPSTPGAVPSAGGATSVGEASIIDLRERQARPNKPAAPSEPADRMIRRIPAMAQPERPAVSVAPERPAASAVELTPAGLERRRSRPEQPHTAALPAPAGAASGRSAEEVRSMLQRYRSGVSAGRDKVDNPEQRPRP